MKNKYFALAMEPETGVVWSSDCMESVKRHAVEDVELTAHIYGWEALEDNMFSTASACIVSGRRVVAAYYYRRGWQRENYTASAALLAAIEKHLARDSRPETISTGNKAPEAEPETVETAAAPEALEAVPEAPEAVPDPLAIPEAVALAPEAFRAVVEAAPRCGLLLDIQRDAVRYKTQDGRPRCIYAESITADGNAARIRYRNGGNRGQIALDRKHECFPVAAVVAGTVAVSDALYTIETEAARIREQVNKDRYYILSTRKPSGQRKAEAKEKIQRVAVLADQAACIIKNAADGIPLFIETLAGELENVAAVARETGLALSAGKHLEAVAAWIRTTAAACMEAIRETLEARRAAVARPETISTGSPAPEAEPETVEAVAAPAAPEAVPEALEAAPAVEAEPDAVIMVETTYDICNGGKTSRRVIYSPGRGLVELPEAAAPEAIQEAAQAPEAAPAEPETVPEARPRRQAPEKPARGPGRPLDFIGQILSGDGWQIVFDTELQRTRVILSEAVREKAAPLAEQAGFYYSVNTDSWHKKLSHKAHRAAEALAEKLRAACA